MISHCSSVRSILKSAETRLRTASSGNPLRWISRVAPTRQAGYHPRLAIWQLEYSLTQVVDRPVHGKHGAHGGRGRVRSDGLDGAGRRVEADGQQAALRVLARRDDLLRVGRGRGRDEREKSEQRTGAEHEVKNEGCAVPIRGAPVPGDNGGT